METKKNPSKDVHRYSRVFFLVGLTFSISIMICAFEWSSRVTPVPDRQYPTPNDNNIIVLDPVRTEIKPPEAKKIPPRKNPVLFKNIVLVSNPVETSINSLPDSVDGPVALNIPGEPIETDTSFFIFVEKMPEPIGGYAEFYKRLSREIKYPTSARQSEIEGKVYVQFIVDRSGEVTDLEVIKGVHKSCDQEAMRVVAPTRWVPGKQRGVPVRVRMVLPINFQIGKGN